MPSLTACITLRSSNIKKRAYMNKKWEESQRVSFPQAGADVKYIDMTSLAVRIPFKEEYEKAKPTRTKTAPYPADQTCNPSCDKTIRYAAHPQTHATRPPHATHSLWPRPTPACFAYPSPKQPPEGVVLVAPPKNRHCIDL